ncbi:MAG TPA: hypothetical protein VGZ47_03255 [Gemmataceae bacterium]|jgi:hypothetical protein|nr:hypothetical protein [Gemmataceae bacterium]
MSPSPTITVAFRIPGQWQHPKELVERLPKDCRLTPESLFLPDGTEIEFGAAPADNQFAGIFRSSLRQPATDAELATVDGYRVNVFLSGPGGSMEAAGKMMRAGAAVVQAGGAGVFIDNCALAHGGQHWLAMTDDGSPDALSFAFVSIISGKLDAWTMGMHVLGLRDIIMKATDADSEGFGIIDVIRYMAASEKPIEDGHVLADLEGPRFQAFTQASPAELARSPMHNPFGRLKLVSVRHIAETN